MLNPNMHHVKTHIAFHSPGLRFNVLHESSPSIASLDIPISMELIYYDHHNQQQHFKKGILKDFSEIIVTNISTLRAIHS